MSYPYPIDLSVMAVDMQPCQHGVVVTLHTEHGTAYEMPLLRAAAKLIARNLSEAAEDEPCRYAIA
jgi:hypothetical protein